MINILTFEHDRSGTGLLFFKITFTIKGKKGTYKARLWKTDTYIFIDEIRNDKRNTCHFHENTKKHIITATIDAIKQAKELRIKATVENWTFWHTLEYKNYYYDYMKNRG